MLLGGCTEGDPVTPYTGRSQLLVSGNIGSGYVCSGRFTVFGSVP